jgi:hypothetical protein
LTSYITYRKGGGERNCNDNYPITNFHRASLK